MSNNNNNHSSDFALIVRQQPKHARVAGGKEKGMLICFIPIFVSAGFFPPRALYPSSSIDTMSERKPVDPPPIVQLKIREESSYLAQ
jgi:hypothetical protein